MLQRVIKLLEVFVFNEDNEFDPAAFCVLFRKIQLCVSQVEHFPVKVSSIYCTCYT